MKKISYKKNVDELAGHLACLKSAKTEREVNIFASAMHYADSKINIKSKFYTFRWKLLYNSYVRKYK